ncbi:MAG: TIGR01841 family phasin [Sphingomonadales bacterium]
MATTASPYSSWFETGNPFVRSAQAQVDAFGKLAQIGADAMRQVMKQQQDMFLTVMGRWRDAADTRAKDPAALLELPLEAARFNAELAMRNASELADIARQTQSDMLAVLNARAEQATADAVHAAEEGMKETGKMAKKAVEKAVETSDASVEQIALAGKMVE